MMLQEVQEKLPSLSSRSCIAQLAEGLEVIIAQTIYGVATFYAQFSLGSQREISCADMQRYSLSCQEFHADL